MKRIGTNCTIAYNVGPMQVEKDLNIDFAVGKSVSKGISIEYSIQGLVEKSQDIYFDTLVEVENKIEINFGFRKAVETFVEIDFEIYNQRELNKRRQVESNLLYVFWSFNPSGERNVSSSV